MQVKIQFKKEIHLYKGSAEIVAIKDYVKSHFKKVEKTEFSLGYFDEENDFITVSCDEDLGALQEMPKMPKIIVELESSQESEQKKGEQTGQKADEKSEQKPQSSQNGDGIEELFGMFTGMAGNQQNGQNQQCPLVGEVFKNLQQSGLVENVVNGLFNPQNQQNQQQQQQQSGKQEQCPFQNLGGMFQNMGGQQQNQQNPLGGLLGAFANFMPQQQQNQSSQNINNLFEMFQPPQQQEQQQQNQQSSDEDFEFFEKKEEKTQEPQEPKEKVLAKEFSNECYKKAQEVSEIMGGFADDYLGVCDAFSGRDLDYIVERIIIDSELTKRLSSYKK